MPYIEKDNRFFYDAVIRKLFENSPSLGDLNYTIYKILLTHLERTKRAYVDYNAIMGLLSSISFEFHRKFMSPFEDEKEKVNGVICLKEMKN